MNAMTDLKSKTPTDKGGGILELITSLPPVTQQALDSKLPSLTAKEDKQRLNQRVRLIDSDINTSIGEHSTKDTLGLVLLNNQGEPASLAYLGNDEVRVIDTKPSCAFVIGNMSQDSEWWCINGLDNAITLYNEMLGCGHDITVLACLNEWQFISTVKHFAKIKTVHINILAHQRHYLPKLAGENVTAVVTILELGELLETDATYSDLLQMDDVEIIDLKSEAWGKPESLANDPSQPTPYPIDAWCNTLQNAIKAIAFHAQVPLAMAGQCVLGAIAHMGQRLVDAPMGHNHLPTSLILITEGESGSGKTKAMGLSHFKIDQYERQLYQDYINELNAWEADKTSLSGKELKDYLTDNPKPVSAITMFSDATIEPILDSFVSGELVNASWSTSEAGQFFGGHTMMGDTAVNALSAITTLYSDGQVSRTRSQKSNHANPKSRAYGVRLTLNLMGQRVALEKALTDPLLNGQGFLARALIACPPDMRGKRIWDDEKRRQLSPYDDPHLIAYWSRCETLLNPVPTIDPLTNADDRLKIRWHDKQAETTFYTHLQDIENRQDTGGTLEHLKGYASRMAENASRIASLMAFFEDRRTITADDVIRAFMLVEYSTAERLRYVDASPTGEQNDSEKLSAWLVKKSEGKTPPQVNYSDVYNGAPVPIRKNKRVLKSELEILESAGHIRTELEGRRQVIYINPNLHS